MQYAHNQNSMTSSYTETGRRGIRSLILILIATAALMVAGVGTASAAPTLTLEPIGPMSVGDIFEVSGQTTIPAGENLFVTIMQENRPASGVSGVASVIRGGTKNRYSFTVDTSKFPAGRYTVTVEAVSSSLKESTSFDLLGPNGETPATSGSMATAKTTTGWTATPVTSGGAEQRTAVTTTTEPGPTKTSGFEAALALEATRSYF